MEKFWNVSSGLKDRGSQCTEKVKIEGKTGNFRARKQHENKEALVQFGEQWSGDNETQGGAGVRGQKV